MKVFISWSGERSKAVADALRDWLPLVLHYAKPWLSESDIDAGARWSDAVAKELEASNFGIICVTRDNMDEPWLLFEAGALAKSLQDAKVIPLLLDLDLSDLAGPLAQFQAKKVDKPGVHEVLRSINKSAPDAVPPERMDRYPPYSLDAVSVAEPHDPAPAAATVGIQAGGASPSSACGSRLGLRKRGRSGRIVTALPAEFAAQY